MMSQTYPTQDHRRKGPNISQGRGKKDDVVPNAEHSIKGDKEKTNTQLLARSRRKKENQKRRSK